MYKSRSACTAIDFALDSPKYVEALVLCAGGVGGLDISNSQQETDMFNIYDSFMAKRDVENAARALVRIWGDGTKAQEGRLTGQARDKLYVWCKDIADREIKGEGGAGSVTLRP